MQKSSKLSLPDAPNGGRFDPPVDSPQITPHEQGRLFGEPSLLVTASDEAWGRRLPQTADSRPTSSPTDGRLVAEKSPVVTTPPATNGRRSAQTADSAPVSDEANGRRLPQTADSACDSTAATADSTGQSLLNVKDVAAFLLTVFHEAPCKRGYYYQLHQEYPRPECWLAATIETLVGMHQRKAVKNASKYFYDRCVALHQTPTLPLQTQALVAQYAHLSYAQVLAALTAPKAATHAPLSSTRAGQPDQYAAFVASRLAEQRAAYLVSHPLPADAPAPQERLPLPVAGGSQPDQYAAFVARRLAEQRAAWSKGV